MKPTQAIKRRFLTRAERDKPDMFGRIMAILALLAWLVLASDALAQDANQWAPEWGLQAPVAPDTGQVWSADQGAASLYAPVDLDQQLASGSLKAPVAQAPQGAPAQAPIYAPAGTATSLLTPPSPSVSVAAPPYPGATMAPGVSPYGGVLPYDQPFAQTYPQPYGQPYAQPGYGYAPPYAGAPGQGPYQGLYPGIAPGLGPWVGPFGSPGTYGGLPFFGASPFGFW